MRITTTLVTAFLALACGLVQAQAYRWVDKDGKVRYGDSPPPGVKATVMKGVAGPASSPSTSAAAAKDAKGAAKAPTDPAQAFNERKLKAKEDAEKAAKDSVSAAARQKNCDRAQGFLRSLEAGQRISTTNAQGERTFLDDAGRQAQIEETKAEVSRNCT
jgi:hypothetical protein